MQQEMLSYLRCPITRSKLTLTILTTAYKEFDGIKTQVIESALLTSQEGLVYPVIKFVPRLLPEAIVDNKSFYQQHVANYTDLHKKTFELYGDVIELCIKKNSKTKASFSQEWQVFNYETDKVWDADADGMLQRFLTETNETTSSLKNKIILDAGCGNGLLNTHIAKQGAIILGMDFSNSIERAYEQNTKANAWFIQGDVQFPPVAFASFDIVHSSGVCIHTNNTELSVSHLDATVKQGGKISVWCYHKRKNAIHNLFNFLRQYTSKLPYKLQYYLYSVTLFPVSYIVKKLKGNPQNKREIMIDILDWFSPEFRWEHSHQEITGWLMKRNYKNIKITTNEPFGFNIIGEKN